MARQNERDPEPDAPNVRREGKRVWIEGVPTLGWGRDKECTFAGALEAALAVTKDPWTYSDLMGLSSLAFRVRWYQAKGGRDWCPSCAVGEHPGEEVDAAGRAIGWQLHCEVRLGQPEPHMEEFAPQIAASIDAGLPVLAYEPRLNLDVVYGYEEGGKTLLLRDYFQGETPLRLPAAKLGALLFFLRNPAEPPPLRDALVAGLQRAIANWRRPALDGGKGLYRYGGDALAAWMADIAEADAFTPQEREKLFFVSWWNFSTRLDAAVAAERFLAERAALLPGQAQEALQRAAGLYGEERTLFSTVFAKRDAFLGPWSGKGIKDWTPAVRQREQELLSGARKLDAAAIAELEKALLATYPKAAKLDGVPRGQGNSNSYVRGLALALDYAGTPTDYDALMGLSGMAFITQADLGSPLIDGAIDVGWWPMDSWGLRLRLDFLSRATGRRLSAVDCDRDRFLADPAGHYGERFELEVKSSIAARRPVLAEHNLCFVVHGYDEGTPALLGNWAPQSDPGTIRIPEQPWGLIVLGDGLGALDPRAADLECLRHAAALWHETAVGQEGVDSGCYVRKLPENRKLRFTGQRSFAEWARLLRDTEHVGQARWHANMVFHLGINRRSAVACLRAMAARHPQKVADPLLAAAVLYEEGLAELKAADTGQAAMASTEGRERLAKLAESLAAIEARAVAELEKAVAAAGP